MESICKGTFAGNARGRKLSWGFRAVIAIAVAAVVALTHDARAAGGPSVGMVTKVENQAQVGANAAAVGTIVHMNDTLRTGAKARLQVTFRDNTNLTLGENASVVVDRYVFDPDAGVGEATLNATKGAFRLVTGRLSEMPNKDIKVSTPFAALAVRGTDFWWGPIKGQSGVLLVHNSRLEVRKEDCPEVPHRHRSQKVPLRHYTGPGGRGHLHRSPDGVPWNSPPLDPRRGRIGALDNRLLCGLGSITSNTGGSGSSSSRRVCGFDRQ